MNSFTQILSNVLKIAIFLGVTGGLADATISMARNAHRAYQSGLVSLTTLNRALGVPRTK